MWSDVLEEKGNLLAVSCVAVPEVAVLGRDAGCRAAAGPKEGGPVPKNKRPGGFTSPETKACGGRGAK